MSLNDVKSRLQFWLVVDKLEPESCRQPHNGEVTVKKSPASICRDSLETSMCRCALMARRHSYVHGPDICPEGAWPNGRQKLLSEFNRES